MRVLSLNDVRNQRETVFALAERHGAANVRVFGSVVRGEAREESDIDFLVEMCPRHSPWFPSGLRLDCRNYSDAMWKSSRSGCWMTKSARMCCVKRSRYEPRCAEPPVHHCLYRTR